MIETIIIIYKDSTNNNNYDIACEGVAQLVRNIHLIPGS